MLHWTVPEQSFDCGERRREVMLVYVADEPQSKRLKCASHCRATLVDLDETETCSPPWENTLSLTAGVW